MIEQSNPLELCPFCSSDNQRVAFANSGSFLALYNIAPIFPGHSLIIPKMHVKSLRSLPDDLISELFIFARHVTDVLLSFYNADAFNWSVQDNESAGQTIPHLHLHIIIRKTDDLPEPGDWYQLLDKGANIDSSNRPRLDSMEYANIVEQLKAACERSRK
jgi:bis(5'-adenosyl)-triphosphatase